MTDEKSSTIEIIYSSKKEPIHIKDNLLSIMKSDLYSVAQRKNSNK